MFSIFLFSEESKNILILNSYSYDFPLTERVMQGIFEVFRNYDSDINFQVEYLDSRKMLNESYYEKIVDIYKDKFQHMKFDVIICSDNDALEFIVKHRIELFKDIPVVFCGVNGYKKEMLRGEDKITGITEELGIDETIDMALKIHRGTENIIILNDRTNSGKIFRKMIENDNLEEKYGKKLIFLDDFNIGLEEIPIKTKQYAGNSILLFTFFTIDKDRKKISNEEMISRIRKSSTIPIYGLYEAFLGKGIIGGNLASRFRQGQEAAKSAIKILKGRKVEELPVEILKPQKMVIDYNELKRYSISEKRVPTDCLIVNKIPGFYEKNRRVVWFILSIFMLLMVIIVLLVANILKNRKINKIVKISNEKEKANKKFVKTIINSAPSMYSVKDKDGKIVIANNTFLNFFNCSAEQVEGKSIIEIFKKLDYDLEIAKKISIEEQQVLKNGTGKFGIEDEINFPGTGTRWIYSNIVPLKTDEGEYSLRVSLDITNKKNVELELKNAKDEAERASIAKGHFLATMSHEIRTPLNGIISMADYIATKDEMDKISNIEKELKIINVSARRLVGVIDKILDISKIEYGELEFEVDEFNIRDEIKKSILMFDNKISEKNLELFFYTDWKVPEVLRGDSVKYQQIITNLLGNAIKFTLNGYITIEVILVERNKESVRVRFSVKDSGIGISKENQKKIFDKFISGDRVNSGFGLGLAISKELTERMGGEIGVESDEGRGAKFFVEIEFKAVKEHEPFLLEKKEIIVLCDKKEYLDIYSKIIRNINGLGFIIAETVEELETIIESLENQDETYLIIDIFQKQLMEESLVKKIIGQMKEKVFFVGEYSKELNIKRIERYLLEDEIYGIFKELNLKKVIEKPKCCAEEINYGNILVVEDDEINQEAMKVVFKMAGINKIDIASTGSEALKMYQAKNYTIVLMDLELPDKNGITVQKEMRNLDREFKQNESAIIAVTANATSECREMALKEGFDEFITKPVTTDEIFKKLHLIMNYNINIIPKLKDEYNENEKILNNLFAVFVEKYPELLLELKDFIKEQKNEEILKISHKLRGAVGNIRAEKLYELLLKIEGAVKEKNHERAEEYLEQLEKESRSVIRAIKERLNF